MAFFRKEIPVDWEDFDPEADYSNTELEAYATALLKMDIKENGNVENILFKEHLQARARREIQLKDPKTNGVVDPTLTPLLSQNKKEGVWSGDGQAMYNRTHPQGRKVNSKDQRRKNGASYYR